MIRYVTIGANDLDRAQTFYDAISAVLGQQRLWRQGDWIGYGPEGGDAKVFICKPHDGQAARAGNGIMVGLQADNTAQIDAFHAAALANGGTCEGPPGPRPAYGDGYYGAYVRDPDGNKLSAFLSS
ncbi:VOC family protein [Caulobacter sp. ErkDOM-YI]|uniref:VOC family protein n=1 Tax=unclassified Caulobacter TaxID=2648921 RepID=UPI003AF84383